MQIQFELYTITIQRDHTHGCKDMWSVTSRFLWREEGKEIAGSIGLHIKDEIYKSISSPISSFGQPKCVWCRQERPFFVFSVFWSLCVEVWTLKVLVSEFSWPKHVYNLRTQKRVFWHCSKRLSVSAEYLASGSELCCFWFLCTRAR